MSYKDSTTAFIMVRLVNAFPELNIKQDISSDIDVFILSEVAL